jgi:phosphoglycerate dehydrogenase-like enzyme
LAPEVLVIGRQKGETPPGLPEPGSGARYTFADDIDSVRRHIANAEIIFQYGGPRTALRELWADAGSLRWVHIGGVGIDWALFAELIESDVLVTNSRGVFDVTLPEYVLTLMLALAKDVPGSVQAQQREEWRHRLHDPLAGGRVVIIGAGSIARSTARLLRALDMSVTLVGRSERQGESGDERVRAIADLQALLPEADWLIVLVPLTSTTRGLVGKAELAALPEGARLINVGRGPVVVQADLVDALRSGTPTGAALDVFEKEPLPPGDPLWSMPNVLISPHIGGDVGDTYAALSQSFVANLERYQAGEPLHDIVDKRLGYVPSVI